MNIRVYLTDEIIGWVIGKKGWRIKKIAKDTDTIINVIDKKYFLINGTKENVHQARIILQDLEKEYYKKEYFKELEKKKLYIDDLLKMASDSIDELKNDNKAK